MALDTDFIGFSFNGRHSSEFNVYLVSDGSRYQDSLVPSPIDYTEQVPGRAGELYFGSDIDTRTFPISIAYDNLSERQVRELRQWLSPQNTGDLIFDERPYKAYSAKISDAPSLSFICFDNDDGSRVYKGEGSIEFVCYYPYARVSGEKKELRYYSNYSEQPSSWNRVITSGTAVDFKEKTKIQIQNIEGKGGGYEKQDYYLKINTGGVTLSTLAFCNKDGEIGKEVELPDITLNSIGVTQDYYTPKTNIYRRRIKEETLVLSYADYAYPNGLGTYPRYYRYTACVQNSDGTVGKEYVYETDAKDFSRHQIMSDTCVFWGETLPKYPSTKSYANYFKLAKIPNTTNQYNIHFYFLDDSNNTRPENNSTVQLYTIDDQSPVKLSEISVPDEFDYTDASYNFIKIFDVNGKEREVEVTYNTYNILDGDEWFPSTDMLYSLKTGSEAGYDHYLSNADNLGTTGMKVYNPGDLDTDFIIQFPVPIPNTTKVTNKNRIIFRLGNSHLIWGFDNEEDYPTVSQLEKDLYNAAARQTQAGDAGKIIINTKERRIVWVNSNGINTSVYFTLKEGNFFTIPVGAGVSENTILGVSGGLVSGNNEPTEGVAGKEIKIEYDYLYY